MTTAFVLSGGASHGATQVGMLLALTEAGISPDLIIGTSAGAINGGWLASRPHLDGARGLAEMWRGLSRDDVFPTHPLVGLLGFLGQRPNLVPNTALRRLLRHHLEFHRLEEAPTPLHVVATEVLSGIEVLLSSGDAVDAITASASIPAVLPPVEIDGRKMMDGGVVNNTPISHAVALGADTVYVLSAGYACALVKPPRGVMAMALHALTLAVNGRMAADIRHFDGTIDLRVIPPPCPLPISPIDFSHADELIDGAYASTARWLTRPIGPDQSALLSFHRH